MSAWINGFLGLFLILGIGIWHLGLSPLEAVTFFVVSICSGMFTLLITLKMGRTPWTRKHIVPGPISTWVVFLSLYMIPQFLLLPRYREGHVFIWLVAPMFMSTGFTILAFGPIQDRIVARMQRAQK